MLKPDLSYAVEQRIRLIDFLLFHYGTVRRGALRDYFGISEPQASNDLGLYQELAPGNMAYDMHAKLYRRTDTFERIYP